MIYEELQKARRNKLDTPIEKAFEKIQGVLNSIAETEVKICKREAKKYIENMKKAGDNAGWTRGLLAYIEGLEEQSKELKEEIERIDRNVIDKEEFVDIINQLKEVNDFVEETNNKARKLKDAIISDFYNASSLSISHETIVLKLLENMFNDTDMISWWLYELDYGRKYKDGDITENDGTIIDLSTAEKLYDYLVK